MNMEITEERTAMIDQEKIKALAELDGNPVPAEKCLCLSCTSKNGWDYLTSYDAIIPLIQKGWSGEIVEYNGNAFTEVVKSKGWVKDCCDSCRMNGMLKLTPSQLCDALLIATGKMKP